MQKLIVLLIILLSLADLSVMLFRLGGENLDLIKSSLLAIAQIVAISGGIYTIKKYGHNNKTGRTILLFVLGLVFWMFGNIIFTVIELSKGVPEFPSLADVSIFIGYAFLLTALIHETRTRNVRLTNLHKLLIGVVGLFTTILVFYFNVFLVFDPTTPLLVTIATVIYALADILLATTVVLVLILAYEYSGGKLFYPWFYLFLAAMCMLIGDGLFSIFIENYLNKTGFYLIIDFFWRIAYVFFALGLFDLGFVISNIQKNITEISKLPQEK